MKKSNKIMVVVAPEPVVREQLLKRLIVQLGFAITPGDAGKLIKRSVHDYELSHAYFVFADLYNFRESPITTQRLFELAARGIAVVVGVRKLPPEFEFCCTIFHE